MKDSKIKPYGHWNIKENCLQESLKYKNRGEFQKGSSGAYISSLRNGWLDDVCSHMIEIIKPKGYWTKKNCKKEALKYTTRNEFQKESRSAYLKSLRNGWLDDICKHMIEILKPKGYWTKENCKKEALKYTTRNEFRKGSSGAYISSRKNGWLDEVCSHMIEILKPNGYWTKENCLQESLKYKTRVEFWRGSSSAYTSSRKNGWLDEICGHMEVVGNLKMRGIYAFEFEDNHVYVGLTYDFKRRYNEHINNIDGVVYKHIEETNLTPKFIQLTDYMDEELASKEETMWENKYKSNGWNMLNVMKTGGLGGPPKWDYDSCKKEALKYTTRNEFRKGSRGAYISSRKNGWLDDVCGHMIEIIKPNGYWTKENCLQESLKYKTRTEFQKGSSGAYDASFRKGWLDDLCSHMVELRKPKNHWVIKENCLQESLKYKTRSEFYKGSIGAYNSSWKNKWLDEVCSHMGDKIKPSGYWNIKENCLQKSLKYKTRGEFQKGSSGAYNSSWKNKWLNEFFPKTEKV
jgi:predicted GIY-YIG superfamily endonuclease